MAAVDVEPMMVIPNSVSKGSCRVTEVSASCQALVNDILVCVP